MGQRLKARKSRGATDPSFVGHAGPFVGSTLMLGEAIVIAASSTANSSLKNQCVWIQASTAGVWEHLTPTCEMQIPKHGRKLHESKMRL